MIKITFPDGAVKEFEAGSTTAEIAESISKSLAKKALAGKVNGQLVDLNRGMKKTQQSRSLHQTTKMHYL